MMSKSLEPQPKKQLYSKEKEAYNFRCMFKFKKKKMLKILHIETKRENKM